MWGDEGKFKQLERRDILDITAASKKACHVLRRIGTLL